MNIFGSSVALGSRKIVCVYRCNPLYGFSNHWLNNRCRSWGLVHLEVSQQLGSIIRFASKQEGRQAMRTNIILGMRGRSLRTGSGFSMTRTSASTSSAARPLLVWLFRRMNYIKSSSVPNKVASNVGVLCLCG